MTRREPDSADTGVERRLARNADLDVVRITAGPLARRLERLSVVLRLVLSSLPAAVAITPSARHSPPPRAGEVQ
ncbi:hypothetical protein [Streptomyces capitiformicae]|uniref:Uncharacterized protein n=1 Tax=Streptomyces capitiformicae TaxID=2014920 RepID=A0A919DJ42_9ACTN|nr:hypothetical protein [Streptomyces capitiformicae]GHE52869.1 hypothetical protein GCM10017771_75200 [Streptomyces capitiformicae]